MATFVLRVWLPDRPGALGQVASRVGAVRADVVGIEILERGAGRAIDELFVEVDDESLIDLLVAEVSQVDGVAVEEVRPVADGAHDLATAALELVSCLVDDCAGRPVLPTVCHGLGTLFGADWVVAVDLDAGSVLAAEGTPPPVSWLQAFLAGASHLEAQQLDDVDDLMWERVGPRWALAAGRPGRPLRAREREQFSLVTRIAAGLAARDGSGEVGGPAA